MGRAAAPFPRAVSTQVRRAYEEFLDGGTPSAGAVRSVVWDSWTRSLRGGVDPRVLDPCNVNSSGRLDAPTSGADFDTYRDAHPITAVRPLVRSLMLDDLADTGVVLALTDEHGRLLWIDGDTTARDRAGAINFVEGSVWSEQVVGTNAPGLALAVDRGVQIIGPEHFAGPVQRWNCAAAPVHDPVTGHVLGVIDVTGGDEVAAPFALAAVRSVVAAVERELSVSAQQLGAAESPITTIDLGGVVARPDAPARLEVLANSGLRWSAPGGSTLPLSRRHAEILLLLQAHPEGVTTEQLALMLAEGGVDAGTVRAEISRLRRQLGARFVESRPYRLGVHMHSDVQRLRELIADARDLLGAIELLGRGGLLIESTAPGVAEIFEDLREDLRSWVIAQRDVATLRAWTTSPHGRDDLVAWRRLEQRLPVGDPYRAVVGGRIRLLDQRYGV